MMSSAGRISLTESVVRTGLALSPIVTGALLLSCTNVNTTVPANVSVPMPALVTEARPDPRKPALGRWGVEIDNFSKTVTAGDDFFTYVNERWLATTTRPPGYSRFMEMNAMHLRTEERITQIIEQPGEEAGVAGRQKIQDLYRSYTDLAAIEQRGIARIRVDL